MTVEDFAVDLYSTSNITQRDIEKQFGLARPALRKICRIKNIPTRKKLAFDDTLFEQIDSKEKAYWLGFLYADGSITFNEKRKSYKFELCLALKDFKHLCKFKEFLKSNKKVTFREKTKAYRFTQGSKKVCLDLMALGCVPKKSLVLTFPSIEQVPKHMQHDFVRGYFDGDGCISTKPKSIGFVCTLLGTKEFLESMVTELSLFDFLLKKDKRHLNNTWTLRFRTKGGLYFLLLMYKDSSIFLERKYNKYLMIKNCRPEE
jgi:DNA-binding transcriptional regulator WhiA